MKDLSKKRWVVRGGYDLRVLKSESLECLFIMVWRLSTFCVLWYLWTAASIIGYLVGKGILWNQVNSYTFGGSLCVLILYLNGDGVGLGRWW